jgi:hypothetical protein
MSFSKPALALGISQAHAISIKFLPGAFDVQAHELTDEDYVTLHGSGSSAKDNNTAVVHLKLKSDQAYPVLEGIGLASFARERISPSDRKP